MVRGSLCVPPRRERVQGAAPEIRSSSLHPHDTEIAESAKLESPARAWAGMAAIYMFVACSSHRDRLTRRGRHKRRRWNMTNNITGAPPVHYDNTNVGIARESISGAVERVAHLLVDIDAFLCWPSYDRNSIVDSCRQNSVSIGPSFYKMSHLTYLLPKTTCTPRFCNHLRKHSLDPKRVSTPAGCPPAALPLPVLLSASSFGKSFFWILVTKNQGRFYAL